MSPLVVLYLRSDVAWGRLTEETYLDQHKYSTAVIPISPQRKQELLQRIQLWNRCFSLSYFEYRQALKDIADWGRSRITNVDLIVKNRHQVGVLERLDNAIIIPTDDDDWFAPGVADAVRSLNDPEIDVISWRDAVFNPSNTDAPTRLHVREGRADGFWTNSYALTSLGLRRCPQELRPQVLDRHSTTLRTFQAHVPRFRFRRLEQLLAVTVKSPASFTRLKTLDRPAKMLNFAPRLLPRLPAIPLTLKWAEPLIRQVQDLNARLANGARNPYQRQRTDQPPRRASDSGGGQPALPSPRTRIINSLAGRFGYRSYLEIGCGNNQNFEKVAVRDKTGVDPRQGGTHRMTSDAFFESNARTFDLIFIDGLHLEEQVLRDIDNSLRVLNPGGCILVHDCLPKERAHQERVRTTSAWTGDVWKAIVKVRRRRDVDVAVLNQCWGIGAVFKRRNTAPLDRLPDLTWETYSTGRERLLRVLEAAEFERFLSGDLTTN